MQRTFQTGAWILSLVLLASCGTVPKTSVVTSPDGQPRSSVDDSLFARVLERSIAPTGAVSYKALESDTELTEYLAQIALVQTDAFNSRSDLLAFWINTHNAYVLDLIRSNPAHSIDDIPGFRYAKVVIVGPDRYSLDDIEHTMLEQKFREPRAFFALFDGSRSSPALRAEPYSGEHLSDQLDDQLHHFLADSSENYLDRRANTLYLSKIFQDDRGTLEEMTGEPLPTLVRDFAPQPISAWISGHPALQISYLGYDYTINSSDVWPPYAPATERKSTPPRRVSGGIR